jgi:hypothetical protein
MAMETRREVERAVSAGRRGDLTGVVGRGNLSTSLTYLTNEVRAWRWGLNCPGLDLI